MSEESGQKVHRVVAAVDMTETGDNALREAMRIARQVEDSELHVVYALDTDPNMHDATKIARLSEEIGEASNKLKEHVLRICAPADDAESFVLELVLHIRLGRPAAAIHQLCVDVDADIAVVGTHQRRGLDKLLLGSVAEKLVAMARLPVLVAHPKDYSGLDKSSKPEAPRPEGSDEAGLSSREVLHFRPRSSHISGLA
jgi:nucleotide-binding universal stress UspA family protein